MTQYRLQEALVSLSLPIPCLGSVIQNSYETRLSNWYTKYFATDGVIVNADVLSPTFVSLTVVASLVELGLRDVVNQHILYLVDTLDEASCKQTQKPAPL